MYKSYLMLAAIISFSACNSNKENNTETAASATDDTTKMTIQVPNMQCYASMKGKDTVFLKLEKFPNVVTGILKYKLYEKDANEGEIDGKLYGDTLIADYRFKSEGTESVRQVAFLIKDTTATEGYADMEEKDGKMVFKNTTKLDFSKGLQLTRVDCPAE